MITCDREADGCPSSPSLLASPSSRFLLRLAPMALIRRFSTAEKGKAPREEPDPLPPKKRLALRGRDEEDRDGVSGPWCERPPPGFPLPLCAHVEGLEGVDADPRGQRCRRRRRVTKVWVVPPGVHTEGSS